MQILTSLLPRLFRIFKIFALPSDHECLITLFRKESSKKLIILISSTFQREVDTSQFMQTAPWLGLTPGVDGQAMQFQDGEDSPIISLFKSLAAASVSDPSFPNSSSFRVLSRQAEAAGIIYL